MLLKSILLQHFRNYTQSKFEFSDKMTLVIGQNTTGKTNLSESIYLLSTRKSFKTHSDIDMIAFGQEVARIGGLLGESRIKNQELRETATSSSTPRNDRLKIEVVIASRQATGGRFSKKFLINGVAKSRSSVSGLLPLVLFRPEELEIIIDGPSLRREFLDEVLEQVDREYVVAKNTYERSLRQRNALLKVAQEVGRRNNEQFSYWDELLITSGQLLTQKREAFLQFVNSSHHDIFPLQTTYEKSTISEDRLEQYKEAEVAAGVTLVGPHRDDFAVSMQIDKEKRDIRHFGSRGQQRLAVLQLKMLQIVFLEHTSKVLPLLVLDDIFSELDNRHIQLVLEKTGDSQIILTTTHKEFIPKDLVKASTLIELSP